MSLKTMLLNKYELQYCYYIKYIINQYTYTICKMNVSLSMQNTLEETSNNR